MYLIHQPYGDVPGAWKAMEEAKAEGKLLSNHVISKLAEKYGKNAGQIILRFEVQEAMITLPKSTNPERIKGNLELFDFKLTEAEIEALRALDTGKGTHDPDEPGVAEALLSAYKIED